MAGLARALLIEEMKSKASKEQMNKLKGSPLDTKLKDAGFKGGIDDFADTTILSAAINNIDKLASFDKASTESDVATAEAPTKVAESANKGKLAGVQSNLLDEAINATQTNTDEQAQGATATQTQISKALLPDGKGGYTAHPYSDFTQPAPEPQQANLGSKGEATFTKSESEIQNTARQEMVNTEARKMAETNTARQGFAKSMKDYGMFVSQINLPQGQGLEWIPNKIRLEKDALYNTPEGAAYNAVKGLNRNLAPTIRRLSMDVGNATGWEQMGAMMMLINGSESVYVRDLKMGYLQNLGKALDSDDPNAVKAVIQDWIKSPAFVKLNGDWSKPEIQEKQNIESVVLDLIDQGKPFKDVMNWKIKKMADVERKYGRAKR